MRSKTSWLMHLTWSKREIWSSDERTKREKWSNDERTKREKWSNDELIYEKMMKRLRNDEICFIDQFFTLDNYRSCINRFLADVTKVTSDAKELIDWTIMCDNILNLAKSTSHSRTIRLNSVHLAQRRKWSFTQHKVRSLKQCWHDATTRRFSSTIFCAIVMWKVLSLSVNMINMNEEKEWDDEMKKNESDYIDYITKCHY
jgi:hypothetical protein